MDTVAALVAFLLAQPSIVAEVGNRIDGGTDLPPGYAPETDGKRILVTGRGGTRSRGTSPMTYRNTWIRCYAASEVEAAQLDTLVFRTLEGKAFVPGIRASNQQLGQPGQHEGTGWPFMLSIWRLVSPY